MSFVLVTTPLVLHADPTLPGHAVTRQYVDNKRTNVNASWFTTGTIPPARMPALGGDVSSVAASGTMSLNVNGVPAGTYAKVTVDATGRITSGGTLAASDILNVSWTKLTTGRPTTAAGYGITNLIALSGGNVNGNVSSTTTPTAALHAVTKGYVDNAISGAVSASLSVGDVIRKPVSVAPAGFLRCNGGDVSKTTYAALFAVIGDTYAKLGGVGGRLWKNQYDVNTLQTTSISSWATGPNLPTAFHSSAAVVTKNRVYLIGGRNGSVATNSIITAPINADGTLGAWNSVTPLPNTLYGTEAVVANGRVYLITGISNDSSLANFSYSAPIDANGIIGAWRTETVLSTNISYAQVIATDNRLYVIGGRTVNSSLSTVFTATINGDGTLSAWTAAPSLPGVLSHTQAVITKNRVYMLGGYLDTVYTPVVYTALINGDGTLGTWSTGVSLPNGTVASQAVVTNNRVYRIGGFNAPTLVYSAPVNTDGTLGAWASDASTPADSAYSQCIVTNSRIYIMGGFINGGNSVTYVALFSGGSNEYAISAEAVLSVTDFTLPDFSALEEDSINYFIKF